MIKNYLRNTRLWIAISYSNFYQKIRNIDSYKNNKLEIGFYTKLLNTINCSNDLVFDVGANVGNKSVIFSKLAKKVIAFEPAENQFIVLKRRLKNTNVEVFNLALGNSVSSQEFFVIDGCEGYNTLSKKHIETTVTERGIAKEENITTRIVNVETLETFINKYGIPKYIKIDVEGYEYEVIKGLKTPISLISFEANLPEFLNESIKVIEYLAAICDKEYLYNFTGEESDFLNPIFISKDKAIKYLTSTPLRYLEIYAKLD